MQIADIHCHILPYVDDGAENFEEARALLAMQIRQGVGVICVTPHFRSAMFETTDEDIQIQYEQLNEYIASRRKPIRLFLGREYFCDSRFLERLEHRTALPLGNGNTLLLEFSRQHSFETIRSRVEMVLRYGYRPLIAHVERYPAICGKVDFAAALVEQGAWLQINAGSILGREGLWQKRFCYHLMKEDLVRVVASDAHGREFRPPELAACASKLEKKWGASYARKVLWKNPVEILQL